MRVALVQLPPRREFDRHWAGVPGLGLAYVAAAVRAAGHDVTVVDARQSRLTLAGTVKAVLDVEPGLVGITAMTVEFPRAIELARRTSRSGAAIVVGGAHVNGVGAAALSEAPDVDFACIGEGETTLVELAGALESGTDPRAVRGLVLRWGDRIIESAPRPYPPDYDALPFPAWDLFPAAGTLPVLTHRGCPFRCVFCSHNSGRVPRYRTPENVLDEIEADVSRFGATKIRFEDETFGLHARRTKEILSGIIDLGLPQRVRFSAQTRVDRVDRELVTLLHDANFETLELGVESGNPDVLERIGKGIDLRQVETAVALAREAGLEVWCKFILGHPRETRREIRDTIDLIARLNPDRLSVSLMTPYPGTPIHAMAVRGDEGYRLLPGSWERFDKYSSGVLELEGVSLARLKRYQLECYAGLYLRNGRLRDLLQLLVSERAVAREVVASTLTSYRPPSPRRRGHRAVGS